MDDERHLDAPRGRDEPTDQRAAIRPVLSIACMPVIWRPR
jgi:hypothetical protein